MSEAQKDKPKRCGMCGGLPVTKGHVYWHCDEIKCGNYWASVFGVDGWNRAQEGFLAQRKKDFEAGKSQGVTDEYQPMSFDEYIKVKHGK